MKGPSSACWQAQVRELEAEKFQAAWNHRGETTVLIKEVPAEVCGNCGEYDLDDEVARRVYGPAEDAV